MSLPGEAKQVIIQYISDDGETFTVSQSRKNAVAVGNIILGTRGEQGIPERWFFRHITIQVIAGGELFKRRLIVGDPNSPLWVGIVGAVAIDGIVWRVTNRRGERRRGPFAT